MPPFSIVLSTHAPKKFSLTKSEIEQCGINFCPANESILAIQTMERPPEKDIHFLICFLSGIVATGALTISFCLDPLTK